MPRFLPLMVLLLNLTTYGQIDPAKLDSFSRSIDSAAKAIRRQQDSMIRLQDSTYHAEVNKGLQQNSRNPDNSLAKQEKREATERQQTMLRIVIGVVLLLIGIIALLHRRKRNT